MSVSFLDSVDDADDELSVDSPSLLSAALAAFAFLLAAPRLPLRPLLEVALAALDLVDHGDLEIVSTPFLKRTCARTPAADSRTATSAAITQRASQFGCAARQAPLTWPRSMA